MKIDKEKIERRTMKVNALEERENGVVTDRMLVEGYAVLFDQPQTYTFGERTYTETIRRGALDGADMRRTVMRYNHDDSVFALARVKNGSLQMTIDDTGLLIRAELIDTQSNRDVYKMIASRLIDEMSFAFTVAENGDTWTYADDYRTVTREILAIDTVYDVSAVDTGFYESTSIYTRAFDNADAMKAEAEKRILEIEKAKALALANV